MKRLLALAALAAASFVASAQPAATQAWEAGKNYFVIDPPQPTSTPGKIEVTEVFSYGCPACNFAHTYIDSLRKHLPANAQMDFVPASFNAAEDWVVFQRAYLTAKALGIAEKAHDAMFDAVWKTKELGIYDANNRIKSPLPTIEDVAKFYARFGVTPEQFVATANSFTINTRMKQADAFVKATGVDQTPTIVVNGKYRLTTVSAGGSWDKAEQLVLYLIDREASGK
ncbi:MAG: thiol:disulfide interchange protein DsbA/DsbL [Proteobacteria bacterium]|nr:thiol:disulfide interchange protein DsbA/DsbL [Pseudomonadota bacterium]